MFTCYHLSEPEYTPAHGQNGSVSGAITAWELKNLALNAKGFVTCPKSYSEFLL